MLEFDAEYSSGWEYKDTERLKFYSTVLEDRKQHRIWQIENYARQMQNDAYFVLFQESVELRAKMNGTFSAGSPEDKRHNELLAQMRKIAATIERIPSPKPTTPREFHDISDSDGSFNQIGKGFNGRRNTGSQLFGSEQEVIDSWLSKALTDKQLRELIANVDFSKEVLVSYSVGREMNASGEISVKKLEYVEDQGYRIVVRLGVVPNACDVKSEPSYPFVLAITKRVEGARVVSSGRSNFGDTCGPIETGLPVQQ